MRARPLFAALVMSGALVGAVLAGCSTAPVSDGAVTGTGGSSGAAASTALSVLSSPSSPSPPSSPPNSPAPITVVEPGGTGTTTPTTPPATASSGPPAVTTTVTVTPSRTTQSTRSSRTTATTRTSTHSTTTSSSNTSTTTTSSATGKPAGGHGSLAGKVVVIDPGHNGANHLHPEIINQQVPAGFGQYKPCNTTGTETNAGYPEYRFNWNVALALRDDLQAKGITVIMTRDSDDGVGPCVDKRAAIGNDAHADAVVSIHGDGESADIKGFYVMTAARPPAGSAMAAQSSSLASDIRNGISDAGFPVSNALGHNGLWTRSDLAGLNLSLRPTVMIECGNMRNATEAALMSSSAGQQRYATGIAAGVVAFLRG